MGEQPPEESVPAAEVDQARQPVSPEQQRLMDASYVPLRYIASILETSLEGPDYMRYSRHGNERSGAVAHLTALGEQRVLILHTAPDNQRTSKEFSYTVTKQGQGLGFVPNPSETIKIQEGDASGGTSPVREVREADLLTLKQALSGILPIPEVEISVARQIDEIMSRDLNG